MIGWLLAGIGTGFLIGFAGCATLARWVIAQDAARRRAQPCREHGWLPAAVHEVRRQAMPGEEAVRLTVTLVDRDGTAAAVSVRPGRPAERVLLVSTGGGTAVRRVPVEVHVPDTPEGITG